MPGGASRVGGEPDAVDLARERAPGYVPLGQIAAHERERIAEHQAMGGVLGDVLRHAEAHVQNLVVAVVHDAEMIATQQLHEKARPESRAKALSDSGNPTVVSRSEPITIAGSAISCAPRKSVPPGTMTSPTFARGSC